MSSKAIIDDFLAQPALAIVGVSRNPRKFGNIAFRELKAKGYRVYAVNPKSDQVEGVKAYPDLQSLPEPVGGILVSVKPGEAEKVVSDALKAGIRRVWLQPGSESGPALGFCQENHMDVVSGECLLMFAKPAFFPHGIHRMINKLAGKLPA